MIIILVITNNINAICFVSIQANNKTKKNEEKYYLNRLFGDKEFQKILCRVKKQQLLILKWKFLLKTFFQSYLDIVFLSR